MQRTKFKSIINQYETIFFDAFGVLKNHDGLIDGIHETLDYLISHNINYFVLTNDASRSPKNLAQGYLDLGLNITEDKIISSGMLAREFLAQKIKSGEIAYIGTDESGHYLENLGLKVVSIKDLDINKADNIKGLVFLDDEGFDWKTDLNKCVNLLRHYNIPGIVSNTDLAYPMKGNDVAIAIGAIADMIQSIVGKKFIHFGKPDAQMFIFAYEHALGNGGATNKSKILMVGDTLITDIIGGNKFGLDTALVLTGNTQEKDADMLINALGIIPDYICESVALV